jgi:hypothetical protein
MGGQSGEGHGPGYVFQIPPTVEVTIFLDPEHPERVTSVDREYAKRHGNSVDAFHDTRYRETFLDGNKFVGVNDALYMMRNWRVDKSDSKRPKILMTYERVEIPQAPGTDLVRELSSPIKGGGGA